MRAIRQFGRQADKLRSHYFRWKWRARTPDPRQITFFMQTYHDRGDVETALGHLRRVFPNSPLILISDGDDDRMLETVAGRFNAIFEYGERLYPVEHGGRMVQRMLNRFLSAPTEYLFKIDPDTRCHRPFRFLPTIECCFGTLQGKRNSVQGGCHGFTRSAAERIQRSGLLLDRRLADYKTFWPTDPLLKRSVRRAEVSGLVSFDWMVAYAANALGIRLYHFEEVYSAWLTPPRYEPGEYAVTHPDRLKVMPTGRVGRSPA